PVPPHRWPRCWSRSARARTPRGGAPAPPPPRGAGSRGARRAGPPPTRPPPPPPPAPPASAPTPWAPTRRYRAGAPCAPPSPFRTSTLQQEAAKQLGFSAAVTMRLAQQLYEGIELGQEGPVGLITYMRTDSVRVADSAIAQAREYIGKEYGKRYLPDAPVMHKGGKGNARVQDAHEAIRPTDVPRRPDDLKQHLDARQFKLYQLIWRRFVASQMTPAVFETTKVDLDLA